MTFAPNEFLGAYSGGFERPALFQAFFADNPQMRYHITSINVPGSQIITDTFQHVPDIPKQAPISMSYNTASMTVLLDQDGNAYSDLKGRIEKVVNPQTYAVSYAADYLSDLWILQYKEDGEEFRTTKLLDCYVVSLGDIGLDWSQADQSSYISVGLYYKTQG